MATMWPFVQLLWTPVIFLFLPAATFISKNKYCTQGDACPYVRWLQWCCPDNLLSKCPTGQMEGRTERQTDRHQLCCLSLDAASIGLIMHDSSRHLSRLSEPFTIHLSVSSYQTHYEQLRFKYGLPLKTNSYKFWDFTLLSTSWTLASSLVGKLSMISFGVGFVCFMNLR